MHTTNSFNNGITESLNLNNYLGDQTKLLSQAVSKTLLNNVSIQNSMGHMFNAYNRVLLSKSSLTSLQNNIRQMVASLNTDYHLSEYIESSMKSMIDISSYTKSIFEESMRNANALNTMSAVSEIVRRNTDSWQNVVSILGNGTYVSKLFYNVSKFEEAAKNLSIDVNYDSLIQATDKAFQDSEPMIDSELAKEQLIEHIQRAYDAYEVTEVNNSDATQLKKTDINKWINLIAFIIAIITAVFSVPSDAMNIHDHVFEKSSNYKYVFNQKTEITNNYFIIVAGEDPEELTNQNYRIVNCDNIIRKKHDCHSQVVDHLSAGCIVQITGKYRKWRKIIWIDEDENIHSGWIQNYKLERFHQVKKK